MKEEKTSEEKWQISYRETHKKSVEYRLGHKLWKNIRNWGKLSTILVPGIERTRNNAVSASDSFGLGVSTQMRLLAVVAGRNQRRIGSISALPKAQQQEMWKDKTTYNLIRCVPEQSSEYSCAYINYPGPKR